MVPERIEREIVIDAAVEDVWRLVTEAGHLGTWFGDAGAEVELRPGGALAITWASHGTVRGRVERVQPPTFFSFRWARPLGAEPEEGNSTLVELTLSPEGDSTRLRVVESGFRELDRPDAETYAAENAGGWESELAELADFARGRR